MSGDLARGCGNDHGGGSQASCRFTATCVTGVVGADHTKDSVVGEPRDRSVISEPPDTGPATGCFAERHAGHRFGHLSRQTSSERTRRSESLYEVACAAVKVFRHDPWLERS